MTIKKLLITIAIIFIAFVIGYCALFYYTLRTKVNNISDQEPFASFIDKKIILAQDAILVTNYPSFVQEEPLYLDALGSQLFEDISIAHTLQKGDTIVIKKVKNFTNGVSGFTTTMLLGEVTTSNPKQTIPFEYTWLGKGIEKDTNGQRSFWFKMTD